MQTSLLITDARSKVAATGNAVLGKKVPEDGGMLDIDVLEDEKAQGSWPDGRITGPLPLPATHSV